MEELCSALESQSVPEVCKMAESVCRGVGLTLEAAPSSFTCLANKGLVGEVAVGVVSAATLLLITVGLTELLSASLLCVAPSHASILISLVPKLAPVLDEDSPSLTL